MHYLWAMETLTQILVDWGYGGLFVAAAIAGSVVPFSSEAVLAVLLGMGADPLGCLAVLWIGTLGRTEWIAKLGVSTRQLARARKFMAGRGAMMGFFGFLPVIGEAIAVMLGLMRANPWTTGGAMLAGKTLRYLAVVLSYKGIVSLF